MPPPLKQASLLAPARFRFLNEEHDLATSDWNNPRWEKLWLYHLHYFDDLNAVGAERREGWHRALIGQWIANNAPGKGNGWEPYPLSRRIVNWIKWGLAGGVPPPGCDESLVLQVRYLRKRLEWHILGNHLLANAKALIFAGMFFDSEEADCWLVKGGALFTSQLKEQILIDGGHFERSPMYHSHVLEDILDVLNGIRAFPDIPFAGSVALQEACRDAAGRMTAWLAVMSHPDGGIALLNDSAFGDAPDVKALNDYAARLEFRPDGHSLPLSSTGEIGITNLPETGYLRVDCREMTAFLDVAPIGPDYLPGHAHADTLSFELSLGRQRVIVDSGVSLYGDGPERLRQRGSAAHNTVTIDGRDSSEVWGGFRVAQRACPRDLRVSATEGIISCAHDGYRRLPGKPVHHREWHFRRGGLQIRDEITGRFQEAVGRLHFHPEVQLVPQHSADDAFIPCGAGRILLPDGRVLHWQIIAGRGRLCKKTWHPEFGLAIPNDCLEILFTSRKTVVEISWAP